MTIGSHAEGAAKIFGIGLSRTGSKTLNESLSVLGYRSLFVTSLDQLEANLPVYEAFTHVPLAAVYKDLDRRFPGSRFILSIREKNTWLESCGKRIRAYEAAGMSEEARLFHQRLYGTRSFDTEAYSRAYDRYHREVAEHFVGREQQLLTIDICGGEGWETLCPFLGRPVPLPAFPYAPERWRQPSQVLKRWAVRYLRAGELKRALARSLGRG